MVLAISPTCFLRSKVICIVADFILRHSSHQLISQITQTMGEVQTTQNDYFDYPVVHQPGNGEMQILTINSMRKPSGKAAGGLPKGTGKPTIWKVPLGAGGAHHRSDHLLSHWSGPATPKDRETTWHCSTQWIWTQAERYSGCMWLLGLGLAQRNHASTQFSSTSHESSFNCALSCYMCLVVSKILSWCVLSIWRTWKVYYRIPRSQTV